MSAAGGKAGDDSGSTIELPGSVGRTEPGHPRRASTTSTPPASGGAARRGGAGVDALALTARGEESATMAVVPDAAEVTHEDPARYLPRGGSADAAEVGRGGIARVLAVTDRHLGREIAVKELLPAEDLEGRGGSGRSSPRVARFLREARITGQLEHPNIVPVHEVGQRADGTLYYTMKLVRGQTFAEALAGCRGLPERLRLLPHYVDLCHAIAYAHSRGVVHRDLKAANVMVGEFGETIVLDWGLAACSGAPADEPGAASRSVSLDDPAWKTITGTRLGTPAYMSPEQAAGQVEQIDARSDVFSLGAVLHEILTGHPPFAGHTAADVIDAVLRGERRPFAELEPAIPPELASVCDKALARDPAARYQSAQELAAEIAAWQAGARVAAHTYSSTELLRRFAARNRALVAAAGLVLAVVLAGLVAVSISYRREVRARAHAVAASAQEREARLLADYHLAEAHAEKAERLLDEQRGLVARLHAAAALAHNPGSPSSPVFDRDFAARTPRAGRTHLAAVSALYEADLTEAARPAFAVAAPSNCAQVAYSPDGRTLAVANWDHNVYTFDADTGRPLAALRGHTNEVYGVAFSPDGRTLASGAWDKTVRLWDVGRGALVRTLVGHAEGVFRVAFSPDGSLLASVSLDRTVRLWDPKSGRLLRTLTGHTGLVHDVAFGPQGRRLASASLDQTVRLWDPASGALVKTLTGHEGGVYGVAFSPDGRLIASGSLDKTVRLWDAASGALRHRLAGHRDRVYGVAFSPDGRLVASAGLDKTVRLWDATSGRALAALEGHTDGVFGVAFAPHGRRLASGSWDKSARLWDVLAAPRARTLTGGTDEIYGVAYSPDGRLLVASSFDNVVRVWDVASGALRHRLRGPQNRVYGVAFAPDGAEVAAGGQDKTVHVWHLGAGEQPRLVLRGHDDEVYRVAFSPDGGRLASASIDRTVRLWDRATGRLLRTLVGHPSDVFDVSFSPDGKLLASAGKDGAVLLWDAASGAVVRRLAGHVDVVSGVAFSPDGRLLATAGQDATLRLWEVATGRPVAVLRGHQQWVNAVRFSPDGQLLASASDDRTAVVWSVAERAPLVAVRAGGGMAAIAFAPDGRTLTLGDEAAVRLCPLDLGQLRADPRALQRAAEAAAQARLAGFAVEFHPRPAPAR